jgi:hypothetical protein
MSVSSIAANSDPISQIVSTRKQRQQDFQELANALKTGDLSSAQQAFSALQQLSPQPAAAGQTKTGQQASAGDSVTADISALGQALQAGDLTTAQTDFSQLQKDIEALGQKHHHHHHKSSASADTSTTASTSSTDLDQLLASLTAKSSASGTGSSTSSTGLQQFMSLLQTLNASTGSKVDMSSIQNLLGSSINVSA